MGLWLTVFTCSSCLAHDNKHEFAVEDGYNKLAIGCCKTTSPSPSSSLLRPPPLHPALLPPPPQTSLLSCTV